MSNDRCSLNTINCLVSLFFLAFSGTPLIGECHGNMSPTSNKFYIFFSDVVFMAGLFTLVLVTFFLFNDCFCKTKIGTYRDNCVLTQSLRAGSLVGLMNQKEKDPKEESSSSLVSGHLCWGSRCVRWVWGLQEVS